MHSKADPTRTAIGYTDAAGNAVELNDATFTGGALGGLLTFRDETLDPTRNSLGQLAASFATAFNTAHAKGVDLNGKGGGSMFEIGAPQTYANAGNRGSATIDEASFDSENIDTLTSSDYDIRYDAGEGNFQVTRLDTGETFAAALDGNQLTFGGVIVKFDDPGALEDGDRFRVQPTRAAASGMKNAIHDTDKIAAARIEDDADGTDDGSGNNKNALALADLQNQQTVGGRASFADAYASLIDEVGSRANTVQVNLKASQALSDQLEAVQQSQSGVNLDEETMNLVRYQQYYQANAKVLQTGANILDAILHIN
jgi:flagellar hook-associated protein 1 FlgK